ncbi:peptide ABC transporter substrate-binding protein [Ktedonobacter racemifer]|uniref:Extracellular solute-binding protein family 5 n=1 Tax=Ktedonobacter racemifer DSM 44963 TaxID=485913 RepID=D6TIX8_KTERA|nr:peptide ABC transporter substrate-binding protein [Ktedonobacter racemifer]EFH89385.1 extracellular solute-binding protein family 5 [Ktedonobacter racemifer DSM 44963]
MFPTRKTDLTRQYLYLPGLCLLLVLLSACSLFGDASPHMVKAPANKQTYIIPQVGITNLDTLDPALAHDDTSIHAVQMLYTGLVQLNDKLEVVPQLAQSWQTDSDGLTWTFKLKPHLTFSDGTPLTSADVAYSLDRALLPTTQSTVAPLYLNIIKGASQVIAGRSASIIGTGVTTPDASTVMITTEQPATYLLARLSMNCAYVVEKSMVTKYGAQFTDHLSQGGASGPFRVADYKHGQSITFSPNTHYYNARPQLQKVTYRFYQTAQEAYKAYTNRQVDTASVPLANYQNVRKQKDFHQVPQLWINYYTMNYLAKPFDNVKIRQAFALAIDKQAIVQNVWKGTALPTNHILPQGMPGYNEKLTGPDQTKALIGNPKLAQTLLKEGLKDENIASVSDLPDIELSYATGVPTITQEIQAAIQQWQKVLNISVKPNPMDYNTLLDKITASSMNNQELQFWALSWIGEYPDPQDWLSYQFGKGTVNNNMNYGQNFGPTAAKQQALQDQLTRADGLTNAGGRLQAYQQAEQQLVNDVAWLPMEQETAIFLRTTDIVGLVDNGQNTTPPDDWAKIYRVQAG